MLAGGQQAEFVKLFSVHPDIYRAERVFPCSLSAGVTLALGNAAGLAEV